MVALFYLAFSNLCGLWFGQDLSEHLSGIVFGHKYFARLRSQNSATPTRGPASLRDITPSHEDKFRM